MLGQRHQAKVYERSTRFRWSIYWRCPLTMIRDFPVSKRRSGLGVYG